MTADRHDPLAEVDRLLADLACGPLPDDRRARLEQLVRDDHQARHRYLEYATVEALLHWRYRQGQSPLQRPAPPDRPEVLPWPLAEKTGRRPSRRSAAWAGWLGAAAAAGILAMLSLIPTFSTVPASHPAGSPRLADRTARAVNRPHAADAAAPAGRRTPASQFCPAVEMAGWRILPARGSRWRLNGQCLELESGRLYVCSLPDRPHRMTSQPLVRTPAGSLLPLGTRFFVDCHLRAAPSQGTASHSSAPQSEETAMNVTANPLHVLRLYVLAGTVLLSNPMGQLQAGPGQAAQATSTTAPEKLKAQGNYAEALAIYRQLITDPAHRGKEAATDVLEAQQCLARLNRIAEWDDLAEQVVKAHPDDWRVLQAVANGYLRAPHYGSMIDNRFVRGTWRGRVVQTQMRDRRRAMQLYQQALPHALKDTDHAAAADFLGHFAALFPTGGDAWRLQVLTDLTRLPDYGEPVYHRSSPAAPVDADGNPVYYTVPESWEAAKNDGQRWRWLLDRMAKTDPSRADKALLTWADFLWRQFGVHTMGYAPRLDLDSDKVEAGPFAVHTLQPTETIARLANGIRRFELPDEYNFIKLYEQLADRAPNKQPSPLGQLTYKLYTGDWNKLPDFDKLEPAEQGRVESGRFDLAVVKNRDRFALVFEGQIRVPRNGRYTFTLDSDDGARLTIGQTHRLDYDGLHGQGSPQSATFKLTKGSHPIRLEYFEKTGEQGLTVTWSGPGVDKQHLTPPDDTSPPAQAMERLARIYENRLQLNTAARYWQQAIERFGPGHNHYRRDRLAQIVEPWGRFDQTRKFAAGQKLALGYVFRNGRKVHLTATTIKVQTLLDDIKAYLRSNPQKFDWRKVSLDLIGQRLVRENETRYLGRKAAEWSVDLQPRPNHWDRRVDLVCPLEKPGAYLVEATIDKARTTRIIVWVTNTAILSKPLDHRTMYFLADARTGRPLPGLNVEFFGFRRRYVRSSRSYRVDTVNFAQTTNTMGLALPDRSQLSRDYQWLVIARGQEDGRFGVMGFTGVWDADYQQANYQAAKAYVFTDRPVYRPGQTVHFKAWVRAARYDMAYVSHFAGRPFQVEIYDGRNQKIYNKTLTANAYGALSDTLTLDDQATLGAWRVQVTARPFVDPFTNKTDKVRSLGRAVFRVEEYRKPEFEVTVEPPDKPVSLGRVIQARVKARYYFGAPVTHGQVKYTVKRTAVHEQWMPPRPWDWFYGPGYWWFGQRYDWYPGWAEWGCLPPGPWWPVNPPEIVAEDTVPLDKDGVATIRIDTAVAKELFGDSDHKYTITAEVTDASRRTIVGTGSVIAARRPFKVYAWLDGGHYRVGQDITAHFRARTPDGKPVQATGKATLYRVSVDAEGKLSEKAVQHWDVKTDEQGAAGLTLKATEAGQYRLACTLTDPAGHRRTGAAVVLVTGEDKLKGRFRFNDLELVADKAEYQPGDPVRLRINTNRRDATVLLFIRPANGVYRMPQVIAMDGQSIEQVIDTTVSDMPDFYVEAVTVSDGQVHAQMRRIVVPPVKRVLNVTVEPDGKKYQPGATAKVKVKLTDLHGKPFVGETVLSVYDKSIEYIAAPNAPDIRAFFWKWQRHHRINGQDNLRRRFGPLLKKDEKPMASIGVFGNLVTMMPLQGGGQDMPMSRHYRMRSTAQYAMAKSDSLKEETAAMEMAADAGPPLAPGAAPVALGAVAGRAALNANALEPNSAQGGGAPPVPAVRTDFADSAFWAAAVVTDGDGIAEVELPMPENLTTWKIQAWAMGHGTVVGSGSAEVITAKDLLIRLQAPRFFVQGDTVTLSANVHNYLDADQSVQVTLDLSGACLQLVDGQAARRTLGVGRNDEVRADWLVKVVKPGQVTVRMSAQADRASDAMALTLPVYVHGMLKTDSYSAAIRPDDQAARLTVTVPARRQPEQTHLEVRYSPSIALAMVDALPYLAGYEYKHTEAAVNRFVPLVITRKLLADMNINLDQVKRKATNLNPQEIGPAGQRAAQWKKGRTNPVFDNEQVDRLVRRGLADLAELQNRDGGWSWTPRRDSDAHTTATVVNGLLAARESGLAVVPSMLARGVAWLDKHQKAEVQKLLNAPKRVKPWKSHADNLDALVAYVLVRAGKPNRQMLDLLYRDRTRLSVYALAMCGLSYHAVEQTDRRDMVLRNVKQYLVTDEENQTAYLNLPNEGFWWRWFNNDVEAHAYLLKLLSLVEPKGATAASVAKYLLNNRKHATWWNSTRDTALAVEALGQYVRASGEDKPDMTVEVLVDGRSLEQVHITPDNLFTFNNVVEMHGTELSDGRHTVEVRRRGKGPLYVNAYLTNFTLEDFITKAGLEIKVERRYYRLEPVQASIEAAGSRGQVVDYRVEKFNRIRLNNGDRLTSGDLVEVELILESKNDYEHLLFEDFKPAGFEPVDRRSGYHDGAYMELRDRKVAFLLRRLARGKQTITYRMRAETPGLFSALPTKATGVYAPELRANSDELKLKVIDR